MLFVVVKCSECVAMDEKEDAPDAKVQGEVGEREKRTGLDVYSGSQDDAYDSPSPPLSA